MVAVDRPETAPHGGRPSAIAMRVLVLGTLLGVLFVATGAMQPWKLLAAGDRGPSREIVVRDFPDVELEAGLGYDGQQFYAAAAELPDLHAAAEHLDDPRYRLLRIFAPLVASIAPRGDATVLVLLELNIAGLALAAWGLASLCEQTGRDPKLGMLALLPIFPAVFLTVVDPLATGLTFAALALVVRERYWAASGTFAVACLTREGVAAVVAAAALALLFKRRQLGPATTVGLSVLPLAAWYLYLTEEIGGEIPERWAFGAFLDVPLAYTLVGAACFALGVLAVWGWRTSPTVSAAAAIITIQIPFFFEDIFLPFGITRVTAPALSLGLVVLADWWLRARGASSNSPAGGDQRLGA